MSVSKEEIIHCQVLLDFQLLNKKSEVFVLFFKSPDFVNHSQVVLYKNVSNMSPILYIGRLEGVGCWPQKRRLLKGGHYARGDVGRQG